MYRSVSALDCDVMSTARGRELRDVNDNTDSRYRSEQFRQKCLLQRNLWTGVNTQIQNYREEELRKEKPEANLIRRESQSCVT